MHFHLQKKERGNGQNGECDSRAFESTCVSEEERGNGRCSDNGGRTAAVLMSLVESCRRCGVEPFAYIRDLLIRVNTHPASRIAELLPDVWQPAPP